MRRTATFLLGITFVSAGLFSLTVFRSEIQVGDAQTIVSKNDGSIIKKNESLVDVDMSISKEPIQPLSDYDDSSGNKKGKSLVCESVVLIDRSIFHSCPTHHLYVRYYP